MIGPRDFECCVGGKGVTEAGARTGMEVEVTRVLWSPFEVIIDVTTETLLLLEPVDCAAWLDVGLVVYDVVEDAAWLDGELLLDDAVEGAAWLDGGLVLDDVVEGPLWLDVELVVDDVVAGAV